MRGSRPTTTVPAEEAVVGLVVFGLLVGLLVGWWVSTTASTSRHYCDEISHIITLRGPDLWLEGAHK